MASTYPNPYPKQFKPAESELDLYTIPSHSSWFAWDEIHETERTALKEFFDGASISRTPKVYKEYRDFIINKYREDPSRHLTFTEIRKSLVGDVSLLRKVFGFLENWGLINFSADKDCVVDDVEKIKVKVEEGPPLGVRVVAVPNSLKPLSVGLSGKGGGEGVWDSGKGGVKFPPLPLASYNDVFEELVKEKVKVEVVGCKTCGGDCGPAFYESTEEEGFRICSSCFESGKYGENSKDNFKSNSSSLSTGEDGEAWSEAETLLLLESVLRHGDNWDLVVQNVKTKTKGECISKLLELPFAQIMVDPAQDKTASYRSIRSSCSNDQFQSSLSEYQVSIGPKDKRAEQVNIDRESGDTFSEGPPMKRLRLTSLEDAGSSLMQQVACLSTLVSPHISAAAADATVTALCAEYSCPTDIFDGEDIHNRWSSAPSNESESIVQPEDAILKQMSSQSETTESKDGLPLPIRIRAAVATALGAAAAHAKLLADQEEREIQHLVSIVIEAEMKKLNNKVKHFEDLEKIMEKEHAEIEELKESLLAERIHVLQKAFRAGISRLRDVKS